MKYPNITRFFEDALQYGRELSSRHGGKFAWTLGKQKSFYGMCNYRKKQIVLALPMLIANPEQTPDTIRHELAHELERRDAHGFYWKMKAREIGAIPKSCQNGEMIFHKYEIVCGHCGTIVHKRQRKMSEKIRLQLASGYRWYNCCGRKGNYYEREATKPDMAKIDAEMREFSTYL